ncbi:MAG: 3-deoxy-7-phosphoheptulonate synthase [Myxococcota bacterium]|jgi:3-deoxy-7-phosphoheptulonate synthase|nr:3-deoxy-7-phosphoheptulonate synthase [Myxococcota bacterium]
MIFETDDLRIAGLRPLIPPAILMEELPIGEKSSETVARGREQVQAILRGEDDRLIAVVGPCSVHDPEAGLDYARRLRAAADRLARDLLVVMRVYFEKPRTIVGWKGLINDPHLDESFKINEGLHKARRFLLDVAEMGLPAGSEFLDPISPQFIADLVSWGAIGARTSESQVHRELASGLSMPVGFKNGTEGSVQIAIDAIRSAAHPHQFLSVTKQGVAAIVETRGNPDCHLILRGGNRGSNYDPATLAEITAALGRAGLPGRVIIDCSHANSGKDPARQGDVAREIAGQVAGGNRAIVGVMLESFLEEGRQDVKPGAPLVYGKSITDACMSWDRTEPVLEALAEGTRTRRAAD